MQKYPHVSSKYELVAFDRDAAMRKKTAELFGIGHPFIDALIEHQQQSLYPEDVTAINSLTHETVPYVVITSLISIGLEDNTNHQELSFLQIDTTGDVKVLHPEWILDLLKRDVRTISYNGKEKHQIDWDSIRSSYDGAIGAILTQTKLSLEKPIGARVRMLGIISVS